MGNEPLQAGTQGLALEPQVSITQRLWQLPDVASQAGVKHTVFLGDSGLEYAITEEDLSAVSGERLLGGLGAFMAPSTTIVAIHYERIEKVMARINSPGIIQTLFIEGDHKVICMNTKDYVGELYKTIRSALPGRFDESSRLEELDPSIFSTAFAAGLLAQLLILLLAYAVQRDWGFKPLRNPDPLALGVVVVAGLAALRSLQRGAPKLATPLLFVMMSEAVFVCYQYVPLLAGVSSSLFIWYTIFKMRIASNRIVVTVRIKG
jgi:hypothetical protein